MSSEVQICNLALTKIGEEQILSLTENNKRGRICNLHYEPIRDAVLRSHIWNFAIKRVELALSVDTPAFDFTHQFALPIDHLRSLTTNLTTTSEWKIENGYVLCTSDSVKLKYIAKIVDTNLYDSLFIEALAARLASEFAVPLTDSLSLQEQMFRLYNGKIAEARSMDSMEGTPDNIEADGWLNSRLSYVSPYNA
tara:strand:- start:345 stop:929 length:585 start_codon:yes stop_codon:yes gene_type:complete